MLTRDEWEKVVRAVIGEADYDIFKQLDKSTAESPGDVDGFVDSLVLAAVTANESTENDIEWDD